MAGQGYYVLTEELAQRALTARNLEDWALCPRKYLLSFFATRGSVRQFLGGPAALGQALRRTLIEFHRRGGTAQLDEQGLLDLFSQSWDGSLCADSLEETRLHDDGVRMLQAYFMRERSSPSAVEGVDLRMEQTIGEARFVAVADRVDKPKRGVVRLVRFTSTRKPPSPASLAEDWSAMLLLALGCRRFGEAQVEVAYEALRPGRLVTAAADCATAAAFESALLRRAAAIRRDSQFAPNKGTHCRWCRSKSQCPAWRR